MNPSPIRLDIYRTVIPMRNFEHAAAARTVAEAIVTRLEFSDGTVGWGETLPRKYVTGETLESVAEDISERIWPVFLDRMSQASDPVEIHDPVPLRDDTGRCMNAATCAMELAASGVLRPEWGLVAPGKMCARVSGILGSSDPAETARRLRRMRWFGLRDFKLKLGFGERTDAENLRIVHKRIGGAIRKGKCTLRVDVNGGWDADSTPQRIARLKPYGVCVVEQPVFCEARELADLAFKCDLPLMADESLLNERDAEALLAEPHRVWWNIRISKNGGPGRALKLMRIAATDHVNFTLGCMVGESSILSAAQRRLLEEGIAPRFVEGNYGRFLLADDLTSPSIRFAYGGKIKPLAGKGLGVKVLPEKLKLYATLIATLTA